MPPAFRVICESWHVHGQSLAVIIGYTDLTVSVVTEQSGSPVKQAEVEATALPVASK